MFARRRIRTLSRSTRYKVITLVVASLFIGNLIPQADAQAVARNVETASSLLAHQQAQAAVLRERAQQPQQPQVFPPTKDVLTTFVRRGGFLGYSQLTGLDHNS